MTEQEIDKFVAENAPKLAKKAGELCGRVIEQAMKGMLRHTIEMQERIEVLERMVRELNPGGEL